MSMSNGPPPPPGAPPGGPPPGGPPPGPPVYGPVADAVSTATMVISIVTIPFTVLILLAFSKHKIMPSKPSQIIINQSIVDLIILIIEVFTWFGRKFLTMAPWCNVTLLIDIGEMWFFMESVFNIILLAVNRLFAFNYPNRYRNIDKKTIRITILISYSISGALSLPNIAIPFIEMTFVNCTPSNVVSHEVKLAYGKYIAISTMLFRFLIPLGILLFVYITIFRVYFRYVTVEPQNQQIDHFDMQRKILFVTVFLTLAFVVSFLPDVIFTALAFFWNEKLIQNMDIITLCHLALVSNSCVNAVIYWITMPKYRHAILNLLRCRKTEKLGDSYEVQVNSATNTDPGNSIDNL